MEENPNKSRLLKPDIDINQDQLYILNYSNSDSLCKCTTFQKLCFSSTQKTAQTKQKNS